MSGDQHVASPLMRESLMDKQVIARTEATVRPILPRHRNETDASDPGAGHYAARDAATGCQIMSSRSGTIDGASSRS